MNREGIRKPAWFAYKYLHALRGPEIALADAQALATSEGGRTNVLVWNWQQPKQTLSNRPFFTKMLPATPAAAADLRLTHLAPGRYRVTVRRTGYQKNDAHSRYLAMGSPQTLTPAQIAELQALTTDKPEIARVVQIGRDGGYTLRLPMRSNDVVLATLEPVVSRN
jgi:xylan 1,4-beta-xylosidase